MENNRWRISTYVFSVLLLAFSPMIWFITTTQKKPDNFKRLDIALFMAVINVLGAITLYISESITLSNLLYWTFKLIKNGKYLCNKKKIYSLTSYIFIKE